jgi:hypothetical protein
MKCIFNISIADDIKKKKYNLHAVLERKYLNFASGNSPYFISININENNEKKAK